MTTTTDRDRVGVHAAVRCDGACYCCCVALYCCAITHGILRSCPLGIVGIQATLSGRRQERDPAQDRVRRARVFRQIPSRTIGRSATSIQPQQLLLSLRKSETLTTCLCGLACVVIVAAGVTKQFTPREGAALWSYNNPALAKEEIRTKKYFNVPPEGVIKADRRYTREFIRKNVEANHASRSQRRRDED